MPEENQQQQPPASGAAAAQVQTPAGAGADPHAALLAELTTLRTWKAQKDVEDARRAEEQRLDDQRKLIEKGKIEELVKQHGAALDEERTKAARTVERVKASERKRELALALAAHNLNPGAADQLMRLWADDFEVVEQGDTYQVRSRDLKAPRDWVAEKLNSEEYKHFVRAATQGGAGAGGTHATPSADPQGVPHGFYAPQTEGEKAYAAYLAQIEAQKSAGYSPGIGLKPAPAR